MKKRLIGTNFDYGIPSVSLEEKIKTIADVGFDACFSGWKSGGYLKEVAALTKKYGLIYQSVHAPFTSVHLLWQDGSLGDDAQNELAECIRDSAEVGVKIVVMHVWIGFGEEQINDIGVRRYKEMLDLAASLGVTLAFENTEGEGYLEYLFEKLSDHPSFGFCIDTGHEMCYNRSRDLITKYGKNGKLVATHINDNMGITGDKITWYDDSHLLPFDGIADWQGVAERLSDVGYNGILTCELTVKNKPERNTHDIYEGLSYYEFASLAYEKMLRLSGLIDKETTNGREE